MNLRKVNGFRKVFEGNFKKRTFFGTKDSWYTTNYQERMVLFFSVCIHWRSKKITKGKKVGGQTVASSLIQPSDVICIFHPDRQVIPPRRHQILGQKINVSHVLWREVVVVFMMGSSAQHDSHHNTTRNQQESYFVSTIQSVYKTFFIKLRNNENQPKWCHIIHFPSTSIHQGSEGTGGCNTIAASHLNHGTYCCHLYTSNII